MKRRWFRYLALGLLSYAVFLVVLLPAGWLTWGVARLSDNRVFLDDGRGTIWHGSGHLFVRDLKGAAQDLGRAEWRLDTLQLLLLRGQVRLHASGPQSDMFATLRATPWGLSLNETRLSASAELASTFYPDASGFAPQGLLRVRTNRLAFGRDGLQGNAELYWDQAGSALSSVQPLGNYRLNVSGKGKEATLQLATVDGALDLSGQGRWQVIGDGVLQLTAIAQAKQQAADLQPLLRLMGRDLGGGRTAFTLRTRLVLGWRWPLL
jgi:general secretion pathway protein N